ncbi:MAG: right-handed parallel beta-helix repeat-containing protein [Alphaproteobacteria bacterium]|nr:right-handed parallel beta-helix repeat-containing protein [Alphaproteobacteria bacterium]
MSVPELTGKTTRADGIEERPTYDFGVPESFSNSDSAISGAVFNVLDYGAKSDPDFNNQPAIQAAIDAANEAGGGVVYIPPGTFGIAASPDGYGSIHVDSNVYLQGAGMGETVLRLVDGHDGTVTGLVRSPWGEETTNWGVADLTIDGNMANTSGQVDGFFTGPEPGQTISDQDVFVARVEITGVSRYGFDPHELTERLTIQDSVAHHNGVDGFVLDMIVEGNISGNESFENGRHGFNIVTTSQDLLLSNNVSHDNGGAGFVVQRGSEIIESPSIITFSGGESYNNGREGVLVQFSDHVTVEGMEIHHNGMQGVRLFGASNSTVENNKIHDNSQARDQGYSEVEIESYQPENAGPGNPAYDASGNTVSGNAIFAEGEVRASYGVEEIGVDFTANDISGNSVSGMQRGAQIEDGGSFKQIDGQDEGGHVVGTSGDDRITGSSQNASELYGKNGNDEVAGGAGHDLLHGGKGDDVLVGGSGDDLVRGGSGDDVLIAGLGNDDYRGGSGVDVLSYAALGDGVDLNASTKTASTSSGSDKFSSIEVYQATEFADTIRGSDKNEVFIANGGDDVIRSAGGRDTLAGGEGNDTFQYFGRDVVKSDGTHRGVDAIMDYEAGDIIDVSDIARGDAGRIKLVSNDDGGLIVRAVINGQEVDVVELVGVEDPADVRFELGTHPDADRKLMGTDGDDTLLGAGGKDELHGGAGNDLIKGSGGNDRLFGEAGADTILGGAGDDAINGGAGNDLLRGGDGNDGFFAGGGDDIVKGERGNDTIFGDGGNDTISGSSGTDKLYGGSGRDHLLGGGQNDQLFGGNDDDVLEGNSGDDVVNGEAGNDHLKGQSGNDILDGGLGDDVISGGSGHDHIYASVGADIYDGDGGIDTLDFSRIDSGVSVNASSKTASGPVGLSFDSIESYIGTAHDDTFRGSDRNEALDGGEGSDLIRSAGGSDLVTGGAGNDVFQYSRRDILDGNGEHRGVDLITDYQVGDVIDLTDIGLKDDDGPRLVESENGLTVMATIDGSEVAVLELEGLTKGDQVTFGSADDIFAA